MVNAIHFKDVAPAVCGNVLSNHQTDSRNTKGFAESLTVLMILM